MGKKSKVASYRAHRAPEMQTVYTLFGDKRDNHDWDPLAGAMDRRDQSYVKNVRPRSDGQQALMTAIETHNLALAIGPAGSGKTFRSISAAVEAFEKGKVDRIILSRPA